MASRWWTADAGAEEDNTDAAQVRLNPVSFTDSNNRRAVLSCGT
jgi:hypothetical protein